MQKRDKFGRFLKKSITKKSGKKANKKAHRNGSGHSKLIIAQKAKRIPTFKSPKLSELTLFDLQDMIQGEVAFQMKEIW